MNVSDSEANRRAMRMGRYANPYPSGVPVRRVSCCELEIAPTAVDRSISHSAFHDPHGTLQHLGRLKSLQTKIVRATRTLVVQETDTRTAVKERVQNHTIAQR